MRQVNLLYRQLIIIILWQVISCSGTSDNKTTTPATLFTSLKTIISSTTTVSSKVSRVNDYLLNNLTADGSIEGDIKINNNTVNITLTSTNDFVSNATTNADQKTNQTSDINNNSTHSHHNNTNYTNDFNEDKLNITSRRKWTEPEKIISRIKRARGRGKNQGYDATDRAKAQSGGKSSAFPTINFKITEKQFTIYLTSTLSMIILSMTQSLPVSL
uniref:Uncharacterized protein n=1 Tax=Tetranychus urticae TaxID=32264 RepID=T1L370_TETUR